MNRSTGILEIATEIINEAGERFHEQIYELIKKCGKKN